MSPDFDEIRAAQSRHWDQIDRHYRFMIPLWFISGAAGLGFLIWPVLLKYGPSYPSVMLAIIVGFQFASAIASMQMRKMVHVTRVVTISIQAIADQAMEAMDIMAQNRGDSHAKESADDTRVPGSAPGLEDTRTRQTLDLDPPEQTRHQNGKAS